MRAYNNNYYLGVDFFFWVAARNRMASSSSQSSRGYFQLIKYNTLFICSIGLAIVFLLCHNRPMQVNNEIQIRSIVEIKRDHADITRPITRLNITHHIRSTIYSTISICVCIGDFRSLFLVCSDDKMMVISCLGDHIYNNIIQRTHAAASRTPAAVYIYR